MFRLRGIASGLIFFFIVTLPVMAKTDLSATAYKKATDRYYKLIKSTKKFPRGEWLDAVKLFKKVYTENPRGAKTPDALFMTGRIYQFMYLRFGRKPDKENAVTVFRVLVNSYPNSSLSDDALFRTGELYASSGQYDEALAAYRGLLKWFPSGDMAPKARRELKNLPRRKIVKSARAKIRVKKKKLATINNLRHYTSESYTRLVVDISRTANYRITRQKGTDTLVMDILDTRLGKRAPVKIVPRRGPVGAVKLSASNNTGRIVVALRADSDYTTMELSNPSRIVIDINRKKRLLLAKESKKPSKLLKGAKKSGGASATLLKPSTAADAGLVAAGLLAPSVTKPGRTAVKKSRKVALAEPAYRIKTIVIDPGHGGKDPGAVGAGGLKEKDVVLDISRRLKKILKKKCGCRVLLTRNRDVFIPLEERTALANTLGADLFISVHVNSNKSRRARGIETYFLSPARSKEELYTAARENMLAANTGDEDMNDLTFILTDMKNTEKINESSRMATSVQRALVKTVSKRHKVRDHGVKRAMFYVLHGATMPSVLVETAFISNRTEERKLRSGSFRQQIAVGIANGVHNFVADSRTAYLSR